MVIMANPGIAPPEFDTPVGQFRLLAGDVAFTALTPAQLGLGDYTAFSDEEIEGFLDLNGDNVYRAVGFAYMALANVAAQNAQSIKDFDLQIDSRQRAEQLRFQAAWFFGKADEVDGEETFQIVATGRKRSRVELAEQDWSKFDYTDLII